MRVSGGREPVNWKAVGAYEDIRLDYSGDGIAKVTICRPEVRSVGRFHVTDLQVQIRRLPKPVVAMVAGFAIGGGMCCISYAI